MENEHKKLSHQHNVDTGVKRSSHKKDGNVQHFLLSLIKPSAQSDESFCSTMCPSTLSEVELQ